MDSCKRYVKGDKVKWRDREKMLQQTVLNDR